MTRWDDAPCWLGMAGFAGALILLVCDQAARAGLSFIAGMAGASVWAACIGIRDWWRG